MTTENHHIRYDADRGLVLFDEELLDQLAYPDALKVECRSDGLILTAWEVGLSAAGAFVGEIVDRSAKIEEMHIVVEAEQAQQLGLLPSYTAWVDRLEERIYAVPERAEPAAAPADQVAVTIALTVREVQLLEQLALGHGVRMTDILIGFGTDLAAAHAARSERFGMRSGGSDERLFAERWFERNLMPVGDGDDGHSEFARRFSGEEAVEEQ